MATAYPISISQQAIKIKDALNAYATSNSRGGVVGVVPNLKQLFLQSGMDTQSLRILIAFGGTRRRGGFSIANATHREDVVWKVAVTKGSGMTADRGDFLTEQTGNTSSFLDDVEEIRNLCRTIPTISQEGPANDYEGIEPMAINDTQMSGYLITFTTAHDVPQPTDQQTQPI